MRYPSSAMKQAIGVVFFVFSLLTPSYLSAKPLSAVDGASPYTPTRQEWAVLWADNHCREVNNSFFVGVTAGESKNKLVIYWRFSATTDLDELKWAVDGCKETIKEMKDKMPGFSWIQVDDENRGPYRPFRSPIKNKQGTPSGSQ